MTKSTISKSSIIKAPFKKNLKIFVLCKRTTKQHADPDINFFRCYNYSLQLTCESCEALIKI